MFGGSKKPPYLCVNKTKKKQNFKQKQKQNKMKKTATTTEQTATFAAPKRSDLLHLQFAQIVIDPNYNTRIDYGNMEELMLSVAENGITEAIKVTKVRGEERYILKSGHRRMRAFQMAIEAGKDMSKFLIPARSTTMTELEGDLDLLTSNDGKPLTVLEEAYTLDRLRTRHNMTAEDMRKKTGRSIAHIYNVLTLIDRATDKIRKCITDGLISPTLVIAKLKQHSAKEIETIIETRIHELTTTSGSEVVVEETTKRNKITRSSFENQSEKKYGLTEEQLLDLFNIAQSTSADTTEEDKIERISDFLTALGKKK